MVRSLCTLFSLVVVALSLPGCNTPDALLVDVREFQSSRPLASIAGSLKLAEGDTVELSVEVDGRMEVPLHRTTVNPLGNITLPLVGDVRVAGLGVDDARSKINERYSGYYISEPVIVLSKIGDDDVGEWGQVTVVGRVSNPGPVSLTSSSGMRLSAAIQAAGGFATSAKSSEIQVTRLDRRGRKIRVLVNFSEIGKSGDADSDLMLMHGDIVNVPERYW